jgi:hypothetical protein
MAETPLRTTRKSRQPIQLPITENSSRPTYNILQDLGSSQANITFSQLVAASPQIRQQLAKGLRPKRQIQVQVRNYTERNQSSNLVTTLQIEVEVEGKPTRAICDTGSTISIISDKFRSQLRRNIDRPANYTVLAVDGQKSRPLGYIDDLPITVEGLQIPITVAVMKNVNYSLLLGNDFLAAGRARVDFPERTVQFQKGRQTRTV